MEKLQKAYTIGRKSFLETMKKCSKKPSLEPLNISKDKILIQEITFLERGSSESSDNEEEKNFLEKTNNFSKIENLLEEVCSENPLDPKKSKK